MKHNPQQTYTDGQIIDVEIVLSAHHKGHFIFKACPINSTQESPTQDCFDAHPLLFVSDEFYGAPIDENHPERVYVAPDTVKNKVQSNKEGFGDAMLFKYKLKLPEGLAIENAVAGNGVSVADGVLGNNDNSSNLVLIQWYYVASNSGCIHEGYDVYPWPEEWIASTNDNDDDGHGPSAWEQKLSVGTGLKPCKEILSEDGNGIPEQVGFLA